MTMNTGLLRRAWQINWLLTLAGVLNLLLIPALFVGMVVDPKVITGGNGWIKPLKFAISVPIYTFTLTWLLTYVQGRQRLVRIVAYVTGIMAIIEIALITLQVVRGTSSHFNVGTAFDIAVFSTMGMAIVFMATANLVVLILLSLQRMENAVMATALRLGVLASFAGMVVAFLMTSGPTPSQLEALQAGAPLTTVGAHSVGVEDGGPGLPLVGWSTEGGDLRVPHFVGLHGMQIVPLLGLLLMRPGFRRRLTEEQRTFFVWVLGLGYTGWVGLLTWQALRGQSIIAMDLQTGMGYLFLSGSIVVALGITLLLNRTPQAVTA